jgi:hypothetical protein
MGIEFAVADDSELARSLRCVQILLDGSGDSDTDATDRAEPKPEVGIKTRALG